MYLIDNSTAATTEPTRGAVGPNPNGWFTGGDPATNVSATILDADWLNMMQAEFLALLTAASISPSKTNDAQLLAAATALFGTGRLIGVQIFTSSGTYTPNPLAESAIVEAVGGGGSGGGAGYVSTAGYCTIGGPGGAGGYVKHRITSLASSYAVTIGAGGAAVSGDFAGAAGGATYFGSSLIIAHGGWGGGTSGNGSSASLVYFVTSPTVSANTGGNITSKKGEMGQYGLRLSSSTSGFVAVSGTGGQGPFGNGGAGRSTAIPSDAGNGYGSGGGGALHWDSATDSTSVASGAGAPGIVIVWEYA